MGVTFNSDGIVRKAREQDFRSTTFRIAIPKTWRRTQPIPARYRSRSRTLRSVSQLYLSLRTMIQRWYARENRYLRATEIRIRQQLGKGYHIVRVYDHITVTRIKE